MLIPHVMHLSGDEQSFYQDIVDAGLTANLQLVLDAGSIDKGSGQNWLDLSGLGHDFVGQNTVAYNGTPGDLSSSEYWLFDGSDNFQYDSANEGWMDDFHQDNADLAMLAWVYVIGSSIKQPICATGRFAGSLTGFDWYLSATEKADFAVFDAGTNALVSNFADTVPNLNAWNLIGIRIDEAAGVGFHYLNGAYNQKGGSDTWNCTYATPNTGGANHIWQIGSDTGTRFVNNTRMTGLMVWGGGGIIKANMDTFWNATKGRFGL